MTVPISTNLLTLAFGLPGHMEWMVLLVLGLLIFGKRLPEVGRSIGRSIVEFKKGIRGIEDEIETESSSLPDNSPEKIEDQAATRKAPEESLPRRDEIKTEEIAYPENDRTEN